MLALNRLAQRPSQPIDGLEFANQGNRCDRAIDGADRLDIGYEIGMLRLAELESERCIEMIDHGSNRTGATVMEVGRCFA